MSEPNPDPGKQLRAARILKGYVLQSEAAAAMGMHASRLSRIETGLARPSVEEALLFQATLGLDPSVWAVTAREGGS